MSCAGHVHEWVIDGGQSHSFRFVRSWREEITWIILPVCVVAATLLLLEHSVTCAYAVHHRFPFHFSLAPLPLCPAAVARCLPYRHALRALSLCILSTAFYCSALFSLAPLPLCPAAVASGVQSFAFKQEAMSDEKQSEQSASPSDARPHQWSGCVSSSSSSDG